MSTAIGRLLSTRQGKILFVGALVFVVIVLVLGFTICNPMTVVPQGTFLSISPQQHVQYGFARPPNSEGATYGQFTADKGATLIVMTSAQFDSFNVTGSPVSYIYSTGQVNSGGLGFSGKGGYSNAYIKPPGQYYFVFYNAGSSTTTVTVTSALQVETC